MKYVLVLLLVLAACGQELEATPTPLCQPPHIPYGGGCCLDANTNNICDEFEQPVAPQPEPEQQPAEPKQTQLQAYLQELPSVYTFFSDETGRVLVHEEKRRILLDVIKDRATDLYYDLEQQRAWEVCDSAIEERIMGDAYDTDIARCPPNEIAVRELGAQEYNQRLYEIEGPVEWMHRYATREPIRIEASAQQLKLRTIKPTLFFEEADGTTIVLRLDSYYHIPVRVERHVPRGAQTIKYLIDYHYYPHEYEGTRITQTDVTVPTPQRIGPWIEDYKLLITSTTTKYDTIKVQGYLKNQARHASQTGRVRVSCYDTRRTIIGEREIQMPPLEPSERQVWSVTIPADTEHLEECEANIVI